jgi:hypothetical protein
MYMTAHFPGLVLLTHIYMTAHFPGLVLLTHMYMTAHFPGLVQAIKSGSVKLVLLNNNVYQLQIRFTRNNDTSQP